MIFSTLIVVLVAAFSHLSTAQFNNTDRQCGLNIENLWLDVVILVENTVAMNVFLPEISATNIAIFGGSRIGTTKYLDQRSTRIGIVTYNSEATVVADLDKFQSTDDLYTFFVLPSSSDYDSNLRNGLISAEKVFADGRENKFRSNYRRLLLIYGNYFNQSDAVQVAKRMKESGVYIATVQINLNVNTSHSGPLGNFNFLSNDPNLVSKIQNAALSTNCYCPKHWVQYKSDSVKYGVCLRLVDIPAAAKVAKYACQNLVRQGYLATEYDDKKHDFILGLIKNDDSIDHPFSYFIGLTHSNGGWFWEQPRGHPLVPINWSNWHSNNPTPSYHSKSAVLNRETEDGNVKWENVNSAFVSAKYVCEVAACDTDNYCD